MPAFKDINLDKIRELSELGLSKNEIARQVGASLPTVQRRMKLMEEGFETFQTYKIKSLKARLLTEIEEDIPRMEPAEKVKALETIAKLDSKISDSGRKSLVDLLAENTKSEGEGVIDVDSSKSLEEQESEENESLVEQIEILVRQEREQSSHLRNFGGI